MRRHYKIWIKHLIHILPLLSIVTMISWDRIARKISLNYLLEFATQSRYTRDRMLVLRKPIGVLFCKFHKAVKHQI